LTICVRNMKELPLYARQLVEHLRTWNQGPGIKTSDT
jgi:hypothetical protein